MRQTTFIPLPPLEADGDPGVFVEGIHQPAPLVCQSGVWARGAGSAFLLQNRYALPPPAHHLWLVVEDGSLVVSTHGESWALWRGECMVVPPGAEGCTLEDARDARLLWMTVDGPLCHAYLREMNALNRLPARQGVLPTQVLLIGQLVQVLVRHTDTAEASYQLAALLWAFLAAHQGQSVAMGATLSHEIARVVDTLRADRFRSAYSLTDMAAISRMPVETFRKRFSAELGISPLGYLQFQKMERAKALLRSGQSAKGTAVEIGMPDPYHFSKQFKQVVGMSPMAYVRHVGGIDEGVKE